MKFLVLLALVVFTADCNANVVQQDKPTQQLDLVKDTFWEDYVSKVTFTAEDALKRITQSELAQEVKTLISESTIVHQHLVDELTVVLDQVKPRVETELRAYTEELNRVMEKAEQLKASLVPYGEEITEKFYQSLEEFQSGMIPLAERFQRQLAQKTLALLQNLTS